MKVAVLGAAGGIGQALALLLKNRLPAGSELSLYDIAPVTPGVAADLSHIPTDVKVKGFCGEDPSPALVGADVVLISAGVARKPGMDRSDLFNINAGIVKNLVEKCAASCPKALIGIITKNAVILIGQIEDERAAGKGVVEAAVDAAGTRFRPIVLTAISTVLGMIPIAPTVFWGPMAFAIMGGLLVATVLTLVLLPVLYVTVFGAAPARGEAKRTASAGASL